MSEIVISIAGNGKVEGMHRDEFPLAFLGRQQIERASEIKFDDDAQSWTVWYPTEGDKFRTDPSLGGFDSYSGARSFEVEHLNRCLLADVAPLSRAGIDLAIELRAS